ncbi:MAG TPA: glycosyltransferase family 2 protein, partial [Thermoanaerobaculia bacterium]
MPTTPPLTVFTTFFRPDREHLDEAIRSVLAQSYTTFEYLLINDGDREESERILAAFPDPRIRILDNERRLGLMRSRQRGLSEARGELIALLDSDDIAAPDRLARQVAFLGDHPDHVLVGSFLRFVDNDSRTIGHRRYPIDDVEIRRRILEFNTIAQPAVMARRLPLLAAGGYTP